jgi:hypothetical protein
MDPLARGDMIVRGHGSSALAARGGGERHHFHSEGGQMWLDWSGLSRSCRRLTTAAPTFRPGVEALEGRAIPSIVPIVPNPAAALVAPAAFPVALAGTADGRWQGEYHQLVRTYHLSGQETVTPLGSVQVSGTLNSFSSIRDGFTAGTVVLTNVRGSLTVQLHGPAPLSGRYGPRFVLSYTIVSGTGAFARYKGSGVVSLHITDVVGGTIPANPPTTLGGGFTIAWGRTVTSWPIDSRPLPV